MALAISAGTHASPDSESSAVADVPLDMVETTRLALERQPLLERFSAEARAARDMAVSAAQLPDPKLFGGIQDLPINTDEAYSLSRDSDTQIVVGVSQEFPRAQKRKLRGEQRAREAQRLDAERVLAEREIRRDASLAWISLWREVRAQTLARAALREAELQERAVEIAAGAGRASQAELVMAQLSASRQRDDVAAQDQAVVRARNALYRWIGAAAERPITADPATDGMSADVRVLLDQLRDHPELAVLQARVDEADAGVQLADAAHAPDWRVEVGYGNRREFSDMVLLKVGMDLPLFTRNRQDRDLASAFASREAAQAQWQDGMRQLESDVRRAFADHESSVARLKYYDDVIGPQAEGAVDAALAAWRSGRGSLAQVLEARRTKLSVQVDRLDLERGAAERRVELQFLSPGDPS